MIIINIHIWYFCSPLHYRWREFLVERTREIFNGNTSGVFNQKISKNASEVEALMSEAEGVRTWRLNCLLWIFLFLSSLKSSSLLHLFFLDSGNSSCILTKWQREIHCTRDDKWSINVLICLPLWKVMLWIFFYVLCKQWLPLFLFWISIVYLLQ